MNKNILVACFALAGALCVFSVDAAAQSGRNCTTWVGNGCIYGGTVVGPCPGWFNCQSEGPYLVTCQAMTDQCSPVNSTSETCSHCPSAGGPICLATGNTFIEQTDVSIAGLAGGLTLERTWNSMWPSTQATFQVGMFGPNWRSTYEERVFVGTDNYIKYARSDGSFWSFGMGGGGWNVVAPKNAGATLSLGTSSWTLTLKNGEQRQFNSATGRLIAIIDRNGNTTQLTYDTSDRLVTVTDAASRHLYFAYSGTSNTLVTSVASDVGLSLSYSYDNQGRLIKVTKPDQSTLSFEYNAQSLITVVRDADGKILESHTYDSFGRGLTSSRAGGVGSVTISYPNPPPKPAPPAMYVP